MCGKKFQIYAVYIPRKCIDLRHFFSCLSPFKTRPQVLVIISHPRQQEITHSLRQHSFEYLFPPTVWRGVRNYDLLYQSSFRNMKMTFEH